MPGPYIQTAAVCEKVLNERDGVLSLVRVIDRLQLMTTAAGAPSELPEGGIINVTYVVMLKPDDARGRHPISITIENPAGIRSPAQTLDVIFEGEDRGVNLILNLQFEAMEGLYWFSVAIEDRLLTKTPLRVSYQRMPGSV